MSAERTAPLAGVQIRVSPLQGPSAPATLLTDRQGRFKAGNLSEGTFRVTASKKPYLTTEFGSPRVGLPGRPIVLDKQHCSQQIDIALVRGGVISGQVTDESGEPVAGAKVRVLRRRVFEGSPRAVVYAAEQANDIGEYRLYGLTSGSYYVSATPASLLPLDPSGPQQEAYSPTFYPSVTNVSGAREVVVEAGREVRDINIAILPGRVSRIRGVVLDVDGSPLAAARVALSQAALFDDVGTTQAAADGGFDLNGIPDGAYLLTAVRRLPSGEARVASMTLQVSGNIDGLQVRRQQPGTVQGIVAFESDGSRPRPRIQVRAVPVDSSQLTPSTQSPGTTTAPDGSFTLTAPPGLHWLLPFNIDSQWGLKAVLVNGTDVTDDGIEIAPGRELTNVRVIVSDKLAQLVGSVAGGAGAACQGDCMVVAFPQARERWKPASRYIKIAPIDNDGKFLITRLPATEYLVIALKDLDVAGDLTYELLERLRPLASRLSVAEGAQVSVSLKVLGIPR